MRYTFVENRGLEDKIISAWMRSIYYETFQDRSKEIHITDLTNPCLKKVVLDKKRGALSYEEIDKTFLKKTWSGSKLHETPFGEKHEYAFRYPFENEPYEYIYGSADEILDGYIIDKKFYSYLPKQPYEHHVEQVLFYIAILSDHHEMQIGNHYRDVEPLEIKGGVLMYIERENFRTKIFVFEPIDVEEVREEMVKRAKIIRKGLVDGEIPVGKVSYFCKWCDYKSECKEYMEVNKNGN